MQFITSKCIILLIYIYHTCLSYILFRFFIDLNYINYELQKETNSQEPIS